MADTVPAAFGAVVLLLVSGMPGVAKPMTKPKPVCPAAMTDICEGRVGHSGAGGYTVSPTGTVVFKGDHITGTRPGGYRPGGRPSACKGRRC